MIVLVLVTIARGNIVALLVGAVLVKNLKTAAQITGLIAIVVQAQ